MNRGLTTSILIGGVFTYLIFRWVRKSSMGMNMNFSMGSFWSNLFRMMKRNMFVGRVFSKVFTKQMIRRLRMAR